MKSPVTFEAAFIEPRSRASTFFRWLLAIPLIIWAEFYLLFALIAVVLAWFALLFTGRYPGALYNFVAGYLRFSGRTSAYLYLLTDVYAPFSGGLEPAYPVRVDVAPPLERYGRWRVFLRGPIESLAVIALYGFSNLLLLLSLTPVAHWITIVNDGRARHSLHRLTWMYVAFILRAQAYAFLMAQDFPPFFSEWPHTALTAGTGASPPPSPPEG